MTSGVRVSLKTGSTFAPWTPEHEADIQSLADSLRRAGLTITFEPGETLPADRLVKTADTLQVVVEEAGTVEAAVLAALVPLVTAWLRARFRKKKRRSKPTDMTPGAVTAVVTGPNGGVLWKRTINSDTEREDD
jgi:hypothetical protein